jgi:ABC-2 type transport system permease protein
MSSLVGAEFLKLRTTRTAYGFLAATVLLTLGAQAATFATTALSTKEDVEQALAGAGVAAALLLVLGIVATTGEHRHGTITSSLLASPDRRRLVAAKLIAYLVTGALLGAAAMAVTIAAGVPWLSARDAPLELLDAGDYLGLVAEGIAAAALSGAIGVGIGAIVRNQVAAVVGALIYLFILEPLVGLLSSRVAAFTIGGTQSALTGTPMDDALGPLAAGLVLAAWALALSAVGAEVEERRDVV